MNTFDYIFYTSWLYLSLLIIGEILLIDIPASSSNQAKIKSAIDYYLNRKNKLFYKITPLFCLLQIIGIIANIVMHFTDFKISAFTILALAILLVMVQTIKNVNVVVKLKEKISNNDFNTEKELKSIFVAHLYTLSFLILILLCYIFKF
jgi:hypothetical protein